MDNIIAEPATEIMHKNIEVAIASSATQSLSPSDSKIIPTETAKIRNGTVAAIRAIAPSRPTLYCFKATNAIAIAARHPTRLNIALPTTSHPLSTITDDRTVMANAIATIEPITATIACHFIF